MRTGATYLLFTPAITGFIGLYILIAYEQFIHMGT
jgi:hypothetical protein